MGASADLAAAASELLRQRPTLAVAALLAAAVALLMLVSTARQYRRLAHFKGPRTAGFSKWWLIRTVSGSSAYLDFWAVTRRYGSIARVGPNDLITSDPALMRHILAVRTEYRRSDWYHGMRFDPSRDNIVSMRDEQAHAKLRQKMAAGYSGREVDDLEPKVDRRMLAFFKLLDGYIATRKPIEFGRKVQYLTLDVISDIAFGQPFGFVETDSDVYEYIGIQQKTMPAVMVTTVLPWLVDLLGSPTFKWLLPSEKDRLGFGRVMGIAKDVARERYGPDKKVQRDMLGSFVAHGLTKDEAESEIIVQIIAGSDTTATAIRSTLLHIITIPRVMSKLRAEIAATSLSSPVISDAEARTMPYLQALVKEGLRIWPPVAGLMAKETPPQGDTWKGQFIPGGTRIGYCAWGIFRDEELWGADAVEFRPERWLEADVEKLKEMESTLDLIFSYGRWQCLGRPVALMELNKIFVELVRRYDLSICDPANPWKVVNCGVFTQTDFWVRATPLEEE